MNPNIAAAAAACSSSSRECACVDRTEVAFCDSSRAVGKSPNQGFGEGGPGAGGGGRGVSLFAIPTSHPLSPLAPYVLLPAPPQLSLSVWGSGPCSPAPHTLDGRRGVGAVRAVRTASRPRVAAAGPAVRPQGVPALVCGLDFPCGDGGRVCCALSGRLALSVRDWMVGFAAWA